MGSTSMPVVLGLRSLAFHGAMGRIQPLLGLSLSEDIGSGVHRVRQNPMHVTIARWLPGQFSPATRKHWYADSIFRQRPLNLMHRPELLEAVKDEAHDIHDLLVGMLLESPRLVPHETRRRAEVEFPSLGLRSYRFHHALLHDVKLGFANRAFQAKQKSVVVGSGGIQAFGIGDERARDPTDFEEVKT